MKIFSYLAIALGCFIGANARYFLEHFLEQFISNNFAILIINVLGCFLIGLLTAWLLCHIVHPHIITILIGGFCGGFTTFSSMVFYLVKPLEQGDLLTVILYLCLNIILGIAAVFYGLLTILTSKELVQKI